MATPMVNLELTGEQAGTLRAVLDEVLGDLSSEIAGTDNASYRTSVEHRRALLRQIRGNLDGPDGTRSPA